jgi:heme oxygenase
MTTTSVESSMSLVGPSAMMTLRAATRVEHAAIEAVVPVISSEVTIDGYRRYLARTLGFYEPVEAALASIDGLGVFLPDLGARFKRSHLLSDLAGLALAPESIGQLPRCARPAPLAGVAAALGCAYVLEGSTLGGLILARHLRASLGSAIEGRLAFLTSYGANVGPMWRAFGQRVDAFARQQPSALEAMIETARGTFRHFADWLQAGSAA